jgi:hypothetical protein
VFGPQHRSGYRDPVGRVGSPLRQGGGDRSRARPVPGDRGGERARRPVDRHQVIEVARGRLVVGPGPVRPEVPQVRADGVRLAVDQLGRELGVVEGLVPELPLGLRGEDPVSDPRQRRRDDQGPDQIGPVPGDGLGDPAADVIAGDDRPSQRQLIDQPDDAAGLSRGVVLASRIRLVLVGLAEPPQVRHDDVGGRRHERDDLAVVGPVPRPAVQQQHRGSRPNSPGSLVGQPESVDRCFLTHTGHYQPRAGARAGSRPSDASKNSHWMLSGTFSVM